MKNFYLLFIYRKKKIYIYDIMKLHDTQGKTFPLKRYSGARRHFGAFGTKAPKNF